VCPSDGPVYPVAAARSSRSATGTAFDDRLVRRRLK
jgi:hypothetical protein